MILWLSICDKKRYFVCLDRRVITLVIRPRPNFGFFNAVVKVSWFQNVLLISLFQPKYQQKFLSISALASKKRLNQKNIGISFIFSHLKIIWEDFFLFDLFLETRAEILKKILLVFWSKLWNQKDILKLTDLYK